jgi:two-component system phosphate regulon response regulator PhoB
MRHRVLITDDNADIRKLVRMTLDMADVEVYEADNAASALDLIYRIRPTVVLMDIMMPGEMDGLDACRQIKADADLARTIVIMLTARGQQADLDAGKTAGADAYLVKPFSPLELLDMVSRYLSDVSIPTQDSK